MKRFVHRFAATLFVLAGLALISPATAQPVEILQATALELVGEQTAIERLKAHSQAIEDRLDIMVQAYDKQDGETLRAAFDRHQVYDGVYDNISAWSGFLVYEVWMDLRPFYTSHIQALHDSEFAIASSGSSTEADLAYIDQGMADWMAEEPLVASLMHDHVDLLAQYALHYGNSLRTMDESAYYDLETSEDLRKQIRDEVERHEKLAEEIGKGGLEVELETAGLQRLFFPIEGIVQDDSASFSWPEPVLVEDPGEQSCDELLDKREALVRRVDEVLAQQLPAERLRDTANILRQFREAVTGTQGDAKVVAERLQQVATAAEKVHPDLSGALTRIGRQVGDKTAALAEATSFLDTTIAEMDLWAGRLEAMETASAGQQVLALKEVVDNFRERLPIGSVPGLGQLLEVQSEMIGQIAISAGAIDARAREFDAIGRAIIGKPIYVQTHSQREVQAEARQAAMAALASLDKQLADNGCVREPPQENALCKEQIPHVLAAVTNAMSAAQHLENQYLSQRQVVQVFQARADRAGQERNFADREQERLQSQLLAVNVPNRKALNESIEQAKRLAAERLEALNLAQADVSHQLLLLDRLKRRWQDAVEAELGRTAWDRGERLYLRFCTIDGWRVREPI